MTAAAVLILSIGCGRSAAPTPTDTGAISTIVDRYLDEFARRHPSIAAGNGLHGHDDTLEDFSAASVKAEVEWLRSVRASLEAIDPAPLTADARVDRRILLGVIDGWLLDLDTVRTWTRNPMVYASAITDGVHNLMTMESSPAVERMQRVTAKLQLVPRLLAAARENIHQPPRPFVERSIVMFHGASDLLAHDLARAFGGVGDSTLHASLNTASERARMAIDAYVEELETTVLPQATGSYATGTAAVEARYRAEELIDVPAATLLAVGERELKKAQGDFEATAARVDPSKPGRSAVDVWHDVLADHPKRGELVAAAQKDGRRIVRVCAGKAAGRPSRRRAREGRRRAGVRSRPRLDAFVATTRAEPGDELLLHHRRAGRLAVGAPGRVAAEVQLRDPGRHLGARGGAGPLRAQPVHAPHAGQDPAHLDWPQSVPAAFVGTGRLGALCGAVDRRRRVQGGRSALSTRADQRGVDAHLPVDLRTTPAQRRVVDRPGGAVVRTRGASPGAGGAPGSGARVLTIRPTAATFSASSRPSSFAATTRPLAATRSTCANSTSAS
jgi:hypothetical protein